jgi:hypothetical protein
MWPVFLVLVLKIGVVYNQIFWYQPEQIHLAYGDTVDEVVVTWSTFNDTTESIVEYGIGGFVLTAKGSSRLFVDGGEAMHSQYIHTVRLGNLTYNSRYGMCLNLSNFDLTRGVFSVSLWQQSGVVRRVLV